jgi:hypothetical protein
MNRLCNGLSAACSCLAITLLIVGLLVAPVSGARADDPSLGDDSHFLVGNCADGTCVACNSPCDDVCFGVDGCGPDTCNCVVLGTGCDCQKK